MITPLVASICVVLLCAHSVIIKCGAICATVQLYTNIMFTNKMAVYMYQYKFVYMCSNCGMQIYMSIIQCYG